MIITKICNDVFQVGDNEFLSAAQLSLYLLKLECLFDVTYTGYISVVGIRCLKVTLKSI